MHGPGQGCTPRMAPVVIPAARCRSIPPAAPGARRPDRKPRGSGHASVDGGRRSKTVVFPVGRIQNTLPDKTGTASRAAA